MIAERSAHRLFAFVAYGAVLMAGVSLGLSWGSYPPQLTAALVVLVIAVAISENFSLDLAPGTISLGFPLTIAAIVLLGPTAAALVSAVGAVSFIDVRRGKPAAVILYNLSGFVLVTLAAGWAYLWTGGRVLLGAGGPAPFGAADFPVLLLPMVVVALVSVLGNVLFTSVGLGLALGVGWRALMRQAALVVPNELALAFVGLLIAQVLAVSLFGLLLFVAPLIVARQVYQRYIQLREAYADVVRSMIGVLEAKDPYTRGHSERVAGYALAIARGLQFDQTVVERLEYAALLHDLGKIAITRAILVKPGGLDDAEYATVKQHPLRGADIVSRIPSLGDIVPYVRSHHEWFDGKGYCEGLRGEAIPLLARVLSVADAFDAMTTSRPYRPAKTPEEASEELVRMSGSQFDPSIVAWFVQSNAPHLYSPDELDGLAEPTAATPRERSRV